MTTNELRQVFQAPYSRQKWSHILHFLSESKNLLQLRLEPIKIPFDSNEADRLISSFYELGTLKTSDDEEFPIFEVLLNDKVQIGHNKVSVNNFVKKYIIKDAIRGALVTFSYENSNRKEWRFSFISKNTSSDFFAEVESQETHPKKYTYVFGTEESHTTAIQRFFSLYQSNFEVKDFFEAFEVEALNKEFFEGYKNIYEDFVEYITGKRFVKEKGKWVEKEKQKPNSQYLSAFGEDDKSVRDYVKKLLGRLVFLYFLQKKGWLNNDVNYLKNLFEKSNKKTFLEDVLKPLFFGVLNTKPQERKALFESEGWNLSLLEEWEQIPYLNGGLFEKDTIDQEIICFSKDLFENTFQFFSEYNFTIDENDPEDTQVGIDPEMLGKIFENLLEDNKDKGAFYTPKEIVQYMCRESLIAYLIEKHKDEETNIRILVEQHTSLWSDATSKLVLESLKGIKICDPAIGSGAFPMGMLNELYKCRLALGEEKSVKIKKDIIQNNIYGVDIEKGAVDIARLRFWLALVVDEVIPEPLPNLDFKIMQGNSLLESYQGIDLSSLDKDNTRHKNSIYKDSIDYGEEFITSQQQPLFDKTHKELIQQLITDYFSLTEDKNLKRKEINDLIEERIHIKIYKEKEEINKMINAFFRKFGIISEEDLKEKLQKRILSPKGEEYKDYLINKRYLSELNTIENELISFQTKIERPYFLWHTYFKDVFDKGGFDIVIGNPPYVSTKGVSEDIKAFLEADFGFADDLYNHFFFKGNEILKDKGVLTFITPKTFWTTQTKRNLRDLLLSQHLEYIFDTANPFESAMVDTCITSFSKVASKNEKVIFLDGSKDLQTPLRYEVAQSIFIDTQNSVIFKPTEYNMKIHSLYGKKVKELYEQWWDKISTSKNIAKYSQELEAYRKSLKPGDIALLGCLTEGGQGLATANNGKYIAVRKSTKWAKNILESRPKKLLEVVKRYRTDLIITNEEEAKVYLASLSEIEIATLFDELKEKFGRDIFGQGYIYRLIEDDEVADVETLTQEEKEKGIDPSKKFYVPYDKGDKDGNRWYLETPFAIAWNKENVGYLKTDPKARYQGYQFYFREGFCWTFTLNENSEYQKTRIKEKSVNDVNAMALYPFEDINLSSKFYTCLLNSYYIFYYKRSFINSSSAFQINDARQIPIIIPASETLETFEKLFNSAIEIKKATSLETISLNEAESKLSEIQEKLDTIVNELYGI